jgi:hypothetical protein
VKTQIGRANQRSWKKRKKTQKVLISFGGGDEALYFVIYTLAIWECNSVAAMQRTLLITRSSFITKKSYGAGFFLIVRIELTLYSCWPTNLVWERWQG